MVGDAFNDGYVELWDGERQYRSGHYYDAALRQYAGGFGYLRVGGAAWSTLYPDRPAGSSYRRVFGMGYYEKDEQVLGTDGSARDAQIRGLVAWHQPWWPEQGGDG